MKVRGTYQDIPLLDGEFSLRDGFEPSRGWVRVLLSDLGGKLPTVAGIDEMRQQFNRLHRDKPKVAASWNPGNDVDTTTTNVGAPPPSGKNSLGGLWGDLIFETYDGAETQVHLQNIFWIEAAIEDNDLGDSGDAIVRIDICDERLLWDMGGYVTGWRNRTLNDIDHSVSGKILEWDPAVENPTAIQDMAAATTAKDTSRPILDPLTIYKQQTPYTLLNMLSECAQALPGPPRVAFPFSGKLYTKTAYNVNWKGGTPAKRAMEDLFNKYNLILSPDYNGGYQVYERGEAARGEGGGILDPFGNIPTELRTDKTFVEGAVAVQMKPLCIEVVGDKIVEEIACPHWVMVVKDDGIETGDSSGYTKRVSAWVKADDYLQSIGYSMDKAAASLMANYEMHQSKVYDDVPVDSKEQKEKVKATLRKHLFKSFMVSPIIGGGGSPGSTTTGTPNGFRQFLPMILRRVGSMSHALNMPNMAIGRDFTVYCDGWTPQQFRAIGQGPMYDNVDLEQVDMDDISHVDQKFGVITFKEPRGKLAFLSKYALNATSGLVQTVIEQTRKLWSDKAEALAGKLQAEFDQFLYNLKNPNYNDVTFAIRDAMNEFLRSDAKITIDEAQNLNINDKNLTALGARIAQNYKESMPLFGLGQQGNQNDFNLSEYTLVEPRILAIWGWERNYGRTDDWYRFRTGVDTACPPFVLDVPDLHQFVDVTGATNKPVLDTLAQIYADEYLEKRDKAIVGFTMRWVGFWPVAISGNTPEVSWRMSVQEGEAETESHVDRYQHGIKGRPAAVATWTAFQKPIPKVRF